MVRISCRAIILRPIVLFRKAHLSSVFVVGGRCNYAQRAEFMDNVRATRKALYLRYTTNQRKSYAFFILRYIGKFRDIYQQALKTERHGHGPCISEEFAKT